MDLQLNNAPNHELARKTDPIDEKNEISEPCNKKVKLNENENVKESNKNEEKKSQDDKEVQPVQENKIKETSLESVKKNDSDDEDTNVDYEIPEPGFKYPLEEDASDMLDDVDWDHDKDYYPSITERYLTPYYAIDVGKPCEDVCVRVHSNRICMISLAPSHILLQQNKTITNCNFQISPKVDRLKNKVSGKGKRGAQPLQKTSPLCHLTCSDGSIYTIKCCMNGKLIEVNDKLVKEPELLKKEPHFGGYIAIVLPNIKYHDEKLKNELLNQQQYEESIKKRNAEKEKLEKSNAEMVVSCEINEKFKKEPEKEVLKMEITEEKQNEKLNNMEVVYS